MTTGQYPRRRETDRDVERRAERLKQRAEERPKPIQVATDGRRRPLNRAEAREAARQA